VTEQYAQPNINNPRLTRSFVAPAAPTNVQLNFDDQLVTADTTASPLGFFLPRASQFPTWEIAVKATNAGSTGNPVLVGTIPGSGETIDGAAFVTMTTDQEALLLKSDGQNWRVIVGGAGAAPTSSVSLDITFDDSAVASEPPILFVTWPGVVAAVAAIPGNPVSFYQKTKYRLNINRLTGVSGFNDLTNAEFRSAVKVVPGGRGAFAGASGPFTVANAAQINGISIGGFSFGPSFTWPVLTFTEMVDCTFFQSLNGGPGPGILSITEFTEMRCSGSSFLGAGSIDIAGGATLVMDVYDRVDISSGAIGGAGTLAINLFSQASDINLAQPVGTIDLNIGGGTGPNSEIFSAGETIFFSSGGSISFSTPAEQELYAGGTNPPGAPPQTPPFSPPFRGYVAPKSGFLRGIGVRIPTTFFPPVNVFTIRVYVAGVLTLSETFDSASASQFELSTFGQYSEGDGITVTIAANSVTDPSGSLDDGIVVALRSS